MKTPVLAASLLVASMASAFAADMVARPYTKAPVAPPVVTYDWSGIYIGGAVGGGWDTTDGNLYNAPGAFWRTDSQGRLIYGGFAGIQKQWGNFVLGIEGGWNGLDGGYNNTVGTGVFGPGCIYGPGASCQSRINDIGYIGGRLGYAWNRFMVYGQGGYARAEIDTQAFTAPFGPFAVASATHGGWYAGVGGEYAVLDNLILGIDYKHYEFDSEQHNCNRTLVGCTVVDLRNVSAKVDSVMGRVTFKFNPWSTGPVVARY